ncbi:unnamed protein product, partial [Ilex paraguariensis]
DTTCECKGASTTAANAAIATYAATQYSVAKKDPNHPSLGGPMNAMNSEGMMGQPSASVLAMKMYEEHMKHPHSMDSETSPVLMDANRMALIKSATNHQGYRIQNLHEQVLGKNKKRRRLLSPCVCVPIQ